jgi:hypothetical protein
MVGKAHRMAVVALALSSGCGGRVGTEGIGDPPDAMVPDGGGSPVGMDAEPTPVALDATVDVSRGPAVVYCSATLGPVDACDAGVQKCQDGFQCVWAFYPAGGVPDVGMPYAWECCAPDSGLGPGPNENCNIVDPNMGALYCANQ